MWSLNDGASEPSSRRFAQLALGCGGAYRFRVQPYEPDGIHGLWIWLDNVHRTPDSQRDQTYESIRNETTSLSFSKNHLTISEAGIISRSSAYFVAMSRLTWPEANSSKMVAYTQFKISHSDIYKNQRTCED